MYENGFNYDNAMADESYFGFTNIHSQNYDKYDDYEEEEEDEFNYRVDDYDDCISDNSWVVIGEYYKTEIVHQNGKLRSRELTFPFRVLSENLTPLFEEVDPDNVDLGNAQFVKGSEYLKRPYKYKN